MRQSLYDTRVAGVGTYVSCLGGVLKEIDVSGVDVSGVDVCCHDDPRLPCTRIQLLPYVRVSTLDTCLCTHERRPSTRYQMVPTRSLLQDACYPPTL